MQRHRRPQGELHRLLVHHRQRPRHPQANRTDPAVRLLAEAQGTAAEHLRLRAKLNVNLQTDDHFVGNVTHIMSLKFQTTPASVMPSEVEASGTA